MKNINNPEELERDELVYLARLAEKAEEYSEMYTYTRLFIEKSLSELTTDERILAISSFKHYISPKRASWRYIKSVEQQELRKGDIIKTQISHEYKKQIEKEITSACQEIIKTMHKHLISKAANSELRVFCNKIKADHYRYIAEVSENDFKFDAIDGAEDCYRSAYDLSKNELPPTNPIRLGVALNYSVFQYEVRKRYEDANYICKTAYNEAVPELDNISEEAYKESSLVLQLLKDNMKAWETEDENYN